MLEGISGNTVNGVGEAERRSPRQIFWSRKPETLVHEKMQRHTVDRFNSAPAFETIYTKADRGPRLDPPAPQKVAKTAAQWSGLLKACALNRPALRRAGSEAELAERWGLRLKDAKLGALRSRQMGVGWCCDSAGHERSKACLAQTVATFFKFNDRMKSC